LLDPDKVVQGAAVSHDQPHWQLESEPAKVAPIMIKVVLGIGDVDLVGF
jgi:hypothetical protein